MFPDTYGPSLGCTTLVHRNSSETTAIGCPKACSVCAITNWSRFQSEVSCAPEKHARATSSRPPEKTNRASTTFRYKKNATTEPRPRWGRERNGHHGADRDKAVVGTKWCKRLDSGLGSMN